MGIKNSTKKIFAADESSYAGPYVTAAKELSIIIRTPVEFREVKEYADVLLSGNVIFINLSQLDGVVRNRIFDYLNGVAYIIRANVNIIDENMLIYSPIGVNIDKRDFSEIKKSSIF